MSVSCGYLIERVRLFALSLCVLGLLTSSTIAMAQDNEGEQQQIDLSGLRNRLPNSRNDTTIFSKLDLPTANSIRNAIGLPGPDYWQQQADYVMDVTLDTENDSIKASEHITYTNNSPTDLPYLWFSLEQNLFAPGSDGSKFTPPGSRFNNRDGFEGGYTIESVKVNGEEVEMKIFDTLGRVDLPEAVTSGGGTVELDIAWSFNIPDYGVDRMGIKRVEKGKIYEIAQWFPAVCKFDDVHGWNTLPYLGQGEFYTDFGSYEVTISAPREFVVIGTGELQNGSEVLTSTQQERLAEAMESGKTVMIRTEEEVGDPAAKTMGDDLASWKFKADKVRTFAWTASDATIWDAASITWDDGSTVLVQSVYPSELKGSWNESTQMLRHSILVYSDQWFRYPYPTATNVHGVCGGMEYPMIIFCGGGSKRGLHSVTSHEIGHAWFPMIVNSDERRHPWMDEGFNTFINNYDTFADYNTEVNNQPATSNNRFPGNRRGRGRGRRREPTFTQPIALAADQLRPNLLGRLAYAKPAQGLQLLREEILGPERFDAAFKDYINAWAFKSPQPSDFYRCMENAAGIDLAWFWRSWYLEETFIDQAIASVQNRDDSARLTIANLREGVMPVWLTLEYEDGTTSELTLPVMVWYYTNAWVTDVPLEGKTLKKVTIDSKGVLPDIDRTNNEWVAETPEEEKSEEEADTADKDDSDKADDDKDDGDGDKQ